MFLLHKLIAVGKNPIELNQEIKNLFIKYAKAYIELTSVVSDLQLYVIYLSQDQRNEILESLEKYI